MVPQWLEQGGWSLWVLIALSIISVSIASYKLAQFIWFGVANNRFYALWLEKLTNNALSASYRKKHSDTYLLNQITNHGLAQSKAHQNKDDFEVVMEQYATNKIEEMRGGLKTLEVISMTAPLLGLLGTVLGMINAFDQMKNSGMQIDPSILSAGISQALLTTAAGLIVALPALSLWHLYERMLAKAQRQIETVLTEISIRTQW
ncbi:MotA/TolQ/ExbB proton channel family protein [Colwellia psychrerythraea]|uniref:Biopolymer transport exbB protein n=1 Tax=Colwellia psychrerythraea (strain 34H / ATCC BAA-681) TaxID=167879 RepID=Q484D2_COLP3|nr:MotA/TolQ/ExbB proton channel family protein [Colwellia psychrerythraea]AAZ26683.1 biopolymer transport exbB protein [Colwellia psychrerythraea 34H]